MICVEQSWSLLAGLSFIPSSHTLAEEYGSYVHAIERKDIQGQITAFNNRKQEEDHGVRDLHKCRWHAR